MGQNKKAQATHNFFFWKDFIGKAVTAGPDQAKPTA